MLKILPKGVKIMGKISYFKNVVRQKRPLVLFKQETDLLLATMEQVIQAVDPQLCRGNFVLDGQAYGKGAQLVVKAGLPMGEAVNPYARNSLCLSSQIVCETIDQALLWPAIPGAAEPTSCFAEGFAQEFVAKNGDYYPQSGIYHHCDERDDMLLMVANCELGRFLFSCYLRPDQSSGEDYANQNVALCYAVADTLSRLVPEDEVLRESVLRIRQAVHGEKSFIAQTTVEKIFTNEEDFRLPEFQTWQKWAKSMKGKLPKLWEKPKKKPKKG